MTNSCKKGRFIVFEGIDGSGKSTQLALLNLRLKENNISVYETREPSDSHMGRLIREFLRGEKKTDNKAIAALFVSDRLDHLLNSEDGLKAKIDNGENVICDRYYFSSYAYHSVDMDMDWVIAANSVCADILKPDVTIFIDITPEVAMERIHKGRGATELFETKERLTLTREKYLEAFDKLKDKENILIIDGNKSPEEISEDVWSKIKNLF